MGKNEWKWMKNGLKWVKMRKNELKWVNIVKNDERVN